MVKVFKHNYLDELKQIMTIFPRKTVTIKLDDLEHITQKESIIFWYVDNYFSVQEKKFLIILKVKFFS